MYIYRETFPIITFLRVLFLTLPCLLETRLNSNIVLLVSCNYTKKLTHCLKPYTIHCPPDTILDGSERKSTNCPKCSIEYCDRIDQRLLTTRLYTSVNKCV